jgi:hypothetical protein
VPPESNRMRRIVDLTGLGTLMTVRDSLYEG